MAYEKGSATDVNDLLDKVRIFSLAQGWTVNRWRDGGEQGGKELCVSKGAAYVNLWSNNGPSEAHIDNRHDPQPYIKGAQSLGFDSGLDTWAQPGLHDRRSITNGLFPPLENYYIFGSTDYVHVVVEISAGIFAHFGFGTIAKAFNFTGGDYLYGTGWNYYYAPTSTTYRNQYEASYHGTPFDQFSYNSVANSSTYGFTSMRADIDGKANFFLDTYRISSDSTGYYGLVSLNPRGPISGSSTGGRPMDKLAVAEYCITAFSQQAMLIPSWVGWRYEDDRSGILGEIRDWRWVHMTNYAPGQEIVLGPDTWVVFPMKAKHNDEAPRIEPSSLTFGIAYKKVI